MKDIIALAAIVGAATCLIVYLALSYAVYKALRKSRGEMLDSATKGGGQTSMKFIFESKDIAPIIDSLAKAGPAFWSLVGSMLFLLIAALAAGVFKSGS